MTEEDIAICSAKGCRQPATNAVTWRNPSLHTVGREKVWVACADQLAHLSDHLAGRGFLLHTEPLSC
ncbi:MAG: hypothetical protein M3N21_00605 [Actinomycetota bacterium]|nr:hypothetical protein [Actinomycetota bacterium]